MEEVRRPACHQFYLFTIRNSIRQRTMNGVEISFVIVNSRVWSVYLEICKMNLVTSGFFKTTRQKKCCLKHEVDILFNGLCGCYNGIDSFLGDADLVKSLTVQYGPVFQEICKMGLVTVERSRHLPLKFTHSFFD
ncbi:hypothetical protein V1478_013511 [Vespula squamosa]|uniref:Uncharacterized protein n=1 Tax=Vespula squamosa TaxID=30214 RepID=A0ABD2AB55_VESSQ